MFTPVTAPGLTSPGLTAPGLTASGLTAPGLAQRLALTLQWLRDAVAAHAGRDRTLVSVGLLVWPYLHRLAARFAALALRVQAGRAMVAPARPRATPSAPRPRPAALPSGFGWLVQRAPGALALAGQLRHLLADPDMAALLAAAPQAGRILRPLCRMLGIRSAPDLPPALFSPPASPLQAASASEPREAASPAPECQQPPSRLDRPVVLASSKTPG